MKDKDAQTLLPPDPRGPPAWRSQTGSLRLRVGLVLLAVGLSTAAAVVYISQAPKVYRAEADLLLTPLTREDPSLAGLGLIADSPDPTRGVETLARLVTTVEVARRARRQLRWSSSPALLLDDVQAIPVAQSNVVAVTAEGSTPARAAALANAFAVAAIRQRTARFQGRLRDAVLRIERILRTQGRSAVTGVLTQRLATLEALRGAPDPTVNLEAVATAPREAFRPNVPASLGAGVVGGLVVGLVVGLLATGGVRTAGADPVPASPGPNRGRA